MSPRPAENALTTDRHRTYLSQCLFHIIAQYIVSIYTYLVQHLVKSGLELRQFWYAAIILDIDNFPASLSSFCDFEPDRFIMTSATSLVRSPVVCHKRISSQTKRVKDTVIQYSSLKLGLHITSLSTRFHGQCIRYLLICKLILDCRGVAICCVARLMLSREIES